MPEFERKIPDGDNRERLVCRDCGHIDYQNPKIVAGAVIAHGGRVLLCKRAIEPRRGYWTLPAGYMELGETVEEGAKREALEEAEAAIEIEGMLAVYSISRIGQVQIIYRARFADPDNPTFAAGAESEEVGLFTWDEIPWDRLAFATVRWSLEAWRANPAGQLVAPAGNPPEDPRGGNRPKPSLY
jgi:ADP-ribose pyrophosphatase YjhB (NUDIX family)